MAVADANSSFAAFQTASAALDDENTRTEWCSRYHMDNVGTYFINGNFAQIEDSDTTMVVNSNVFNVVALAPNFRISYLGLNLLPGESLRMHFDINVIAATFGQGGDVLTDINDDCYQFRFYYRDFNSGLINPIGDTSTYSTSNKSDHNPAGSGGGYPTPVNRISQRVNHSYVWMNTTGAPISIDWIEIRVRICNLLYVTSVSLKEATFQTFRVRH